MPGSSSSSKPISMQLPQYGLCCLIASIRTLRITSSLMEGRNRPCRGFELSRAAHRLHISQPALTKTNRRVREPTSIFGSSNAIARRSRSMMPAGRTSRKRGCRCSIARGRCKQPAPLSIVPKSYCVSESLPVVIPFLTSTLLSVHLPLFPKDRRTHEPARMPHQLHTKSERQIGRSLLRAHLEEPVRIYIALRLQQRLRAISRRPKGRFLRVLRAVLYQLAPRAPRPWSGRNV